MKTAPLRRRIRRLDRCLNEIHSVCTFAERMAYANGTQDSEYAKTMRRIRVRIDRTIPQSTQPKP